MRLDVPGSSRVLKRLILGLLSQINHVILSLNVIVPIRCVEDARAPLMISPTYASRPETGEEKTYRLTWGWRDEGRRGIQQLKAAFGNISSILRPHQYKKEIVSEIDDYVKQVYETKFTSATTKFSSKLLQLLSNSANKSYKKYHLIKMKHNYLSQIAHSTRSEQEFLPPIIQSFEKLIPIRQSSVMVLYMTRNQIRDLADRVWAMEQTLTSYNTMQQCKSFYHLRVDGCPKCEGIVYRGVLMVKVAVSHSNKVPASPSAATATTLVNLQQAKEDLQISYAAAKQLLAQLRVKYDTMINALQLSVIYNIQHWFSLRFYYVHFAAAKSKRFDTSKFYFRIRRLVKMKRRVDAGRFGKPSEYIVTGKKASYKFPAVISLQKFVDDLEYDFSDIFAEVQEYLQYKSKKRQALTKRFHDMLLRNLAVLRSRAAWAAQVLQQQLEQEALMKQKLREAEERFKVKMRAALLIQKYNPATTFSCPRYECAGKTFKSHDRLQMHLNWHKRIELQIREKQQLALQWSSLRGRREKGVLERIDAVRQGVRMCAYHAAAVENVTCEQCTNATPSSALVETPTSSALQALSPQKETRPYWLTLSHDQFNKKLKHFGVNMKINMQPGGSRQRGDQSESMLKITDADVPSLPAVASSSPALILPHLSSLTSLLSHSYFYLELVSKHIAVTAPPKVSLRPPTTRIGSECRSDDAHIQVISTQVNFSPHPLVASPTNRKNSNASTPVASVDDAHYSVFYDIQTGEKVSRHVAKKCASRIAPLHCIILVPDTTPGAEATDVRIIDNMSAYGTYIVNQYGCIRAATTVHKPSVVKIGDLICIGVNRHLPAELAPIDANKASVVYRLRKV